MLLSPARAPAIARKGLASAWASCAVFDPDHVGARKRRSCFYAFYIGTKRIFMVSLVLLSWEGAASPCAALAPLVATRSETAFQGNLSE